MSFPVYIIMFTKSISLGKTIVILFKIQKYVTYVIKKNASINVILTFTTTFLFLTFSFISKRTFTIQ